MRRAAAREAPSPRRVARPARRRDRSPERRQNRSAAELDRHHGLAVELKLLDRLVDVGEGLVLSFLGEALHELGLPAAYELLQCGNVEVAVMEMRFQLRHPTS